MSNPIKISVKCPSCYKSLMNPDMPVDNLNSIHIYAKCGNTVGDLYLSTIYGSYNKIFNALANEEGSIIECSCPYCHHPFPVQHVCECKAPVIGLDLEIGGIIKVCTRNGCKRHSLEFENVDDAFLLFQSQDDSGLT